MIYTMERRHYFGSGSMESRWEVHEYSHRCPSGDLPEGKLVYSCKAKKWEVYKDFVDGKPTKYYPAMKKDLAAMVTAWAKNIKAQGFNPAVHA